MLDRAPGAQRRRSDRAPGVLVAPHSFPVEFGARWIWLARRALYGLRYLMRRLVYTSRSLVASDPDQLDAILAVSRERNRRAGITGMLWSDGASFAQVLEGDAEAVEATMKRIRADRRHSHIEIVLDRAVTSRQFGRWSMSLADDSAEGILGTSFLVGFAIAERSAPAERLYDVLTAAEEHAG
jgi:hypothetical protein